MASRWLYLDADGFFASCEEAADPALHGRPVGVVAGEPYADAPLIAVNTVAKRAGVRSGDRVCDARALCPGFVVCPQRVERYVDVHGRMVAAVEGVLPVAAVHSIDELSARLCPRDDPRVLVAGVKSAVAAALTERVPVSVAVAPSAWLAKAAAEAHKPSAAVVWRRSDLPGVYEIGHAIDRAAGTDPDGPVLVYQPSDSGADVFLAKVIKTLFFERASAHPERVRGGAELPLACYVADEAHRYVTSDPAHGDQGFVDRARSLAVFSVHACPSIASMEHALAQRGGGQVQDRSALSVMLANTASKFFLHSSDLHTSHLIEELSPLIAGFSPPTHIRPLSSLAVGECYAALADGRFERRQLEPVLLARDGAAGRVESRVLALPAGTRASCSMDEAEG